jgi:hypothetical protein
MKADRDSVRRLIRFQSGRGIGAHYEIDVIGTLSVFACSHRARRGYHLLFGTTLRDAPIED